MLGVGWLRHPLSHAADDVSTRVLDRPVVIVIPSHILESVLFPIPLSLILRHASQEHLDAIPVFKASETQSGVVFLQYVVILRVHSLQLDPTLDIFVLFTGRKQVVWIVL
jgi:hypothetical protein